MPRRRPGRPRDGVRRSARRRCASQRRQRRKLDRLPAARAGSVLARSQRRRRGGIRGHRAESAVPKRRPRRELARTGSAARAALAAELELPAAPVDLALALDRTQPTRPRPAPRWDRAGRPDALDRRRTELAGPPARRTTGRALTRLAPAHSGARVRSRRRLRRLQYGRRRDLAASRRRPRPPLHLVGHRRPRRPRLLVRLGEHRPLRRTRSPRPATPHLPAAPRRGLTTARGPATPPATRDAPRQP